MPIKELVALAVAIMGGIFVAHPFDFSNAIRKVEFSILREMTRTDNWGDPSLYHRNRYTVPHDQYIRSMHHKASRKTSSGT